MIACILRILVLNLTAGHVTRDTSGRDREAMEDTPQCPPPQTAPLRTHEGFRVIGFLGFRVFWVKGFFLKQPKIQKRKKKKKKEN
jgi:hypothetical protein